MPTTSLDDRIIRSPDKLGGQAHIAGHRIRVKDIVMWYDYLGMSADEIAHAYDLSLADVFAALAFYHAHREALQQEWDLQEKLIDQLKDRIPSKLGKAPGDGKN